MAQYYFGNIRKLSTLQFVDDATYFTGAHAVKSGTNLRIQRHQDIRGSVAGLNSNQDVNFSTSINTVDPATFGLPADLNTTFDRPGFQSHINFLLGRVGRTRQAFVAAGDRFVPGLYDFEGKYNEYDFHIQDTWKLRKNLTVDAGLRREVKLAPGGPEGRVRHPDQPMLAGAPGTNTVRWVEGRLFEDSWKNLGPSLGFAWDPHGNGKSSVRANYRIAYDRLNSFVLSSRVFQNLPGSSIGVVNDDCGQRGGRLANLPKLSPPATRPSGLTQPAAFSNNRITVVDPAFQFPTTHQWAFSYQREAPRNTVAEMSYIGRRGYQLIGAYNANQTDIFRSGFLDAFRLVQAGGESDLVNRPTAADSRKQAGESGSAMLRRLYRPDLNLGNVASAADSLATRLQGGRSATDLSGAGAFPLLGYPQFGGGVSVIDSNDFSTYHGLILQIQRRFSGGVSRQASCTWSNSLDTRSFDPTFTVVATGAARSASSSPFDILNRKLNYAISDFDRTHVWQSNGVFELPFGRGKRWAGGAGPILERLAGGWQLAGILKVQSGRPMTVFSGAYTFTNVVNSTANCSGRSRHMGVVYDDGPTGFKWCFNDAERARFSAPAAGELGDTGRNSFRGPGWFNTDASFLKRVRLTERMRLELRGDFTNLTNTASFGAPTLTSNSTTFGRIRSTVLSYSRKAQWGAKIEF